MNLSYLGLIPALMATTINAQEASTEDSVLLPLVVTSYRTPGQTDPQPQSYFDREQIRLAPYFTAVELLNTAPGTYIARSGPAGQNAGVFVRGTTSGQTLFLLDGVPINDPGGPAGAFNPGPLASVGLESLTLLRGPGTLYGSNAIGGTVAMETVRSTDGTHYSFQAEGGYPSLFRGQGEFSWTGETVGVALSAEMLRRGNFRIVPERLGGAANQEYEQYTGAGRISWRPVTQHLLDLTFRFTEVNGDYAPTPTDPNARFNIQHSFLSGGWSYDVNPWWTSNIRLGYSGYRRNFVNRADAISSYTEQTRSDSQRLFFGTRQVFDVAPRARLVVGLEAVRDEVDGQSTLTSPFGSFTSATRASETNYATWVSYVHSFGPLTLTGGLRYELPESYNNRLTGRVGATYRITATETTLRANYGTAHRAPTLEDRYGLYQFSGFTTFRGNPNLRVEGSQSYEIGIDQNVNSLGIRGVVSLTGFRNELTNLIQPTASFSTLENVGRARTEGIELSLRLDPSPQFTIRASYTYLKALDRTTDLALLRRPRDTVALSMDWRPTDSIRLSSTLRYVGAYPDIDSQTFQRIKGGNYATLDLRASYRLLNVLELYLAGTNLTGKVYEPVNGYAGDPRTFLVGARVGF